MSLNENVVILAGYLGKKPELKGSANRPMLVMLVCTKVVYRDRRTNQLQEAKDWHDVIVWGDQAEQLSKMLDVGWGVVVRGENRARPVDGREGRRYKKWVEADHISVVPKDAKDHAATDKGQGRKN